MNHPVLDQHQSCHCFYNGNSSGQDAWVMTPATNQFGVLSSFVNRLLGFKDCRRRLEADSEVKFFTIRNPSLHPPGTIGLGVYLSVSIFKKIVVLGTLEEGSVEAASNLKSFGSG